MIRHLARILVAVFFVTSHASSTFASPIVSHV